MIKILIGFFLSFGCFQYNTGVKEIDTLLAIVAIFGMAIFINGARELRKKGAKNITNDL